MSKIGIITIVGGTNYGNKLQNYAIQKILKDYGYQPETLRRSSESHSLHNVRKKTHFSEKLNFKYVKQVMRSRLNYKYNIKNDYDGIIKSIVNYFFNRKKIQTAVKKRKDSFSDFDEKFLKYSKFQIGSENTTDEELDQFSHFISGSDQVWNPYYRHTSQVDFLTFAPYRKRITLSPSFGVSSIPDELIHQYTEWINGIKHLSVREQLGAEIIYSLTGRHPEVLVDPTLVLTRNEWLQIMEKPKRTSEKPYVLTYFLGNETKEYGSFIETIAKKENLQIINLFNINDLDAYSYNPSEMLYLLDNSELICTDSFHGAVFSILFKKDFIVFDRVEVGANSKKRTMGSRVETLLDTFNFQDRNYNNLLTDQIFNIDFKHTEEILALERRKVDKFLYNALKNND